MRFESYGGFMAVDLGMDGIHYFDLNELKPFYNVTKWPTIWAAPGRSKTEKW